MCRGEGVLDDGHFPAGKENEGSRTGFDFRWSFCDRLKGRCYKREMRISFRGQKSLKGSQPAIHENQDLPILCSQGNGLFLFLFHKSRYLMGFPIGENSRSTLH